MTPILLAVLASAGAPELEAALLALEACTLSGPGVDPTCDAAARLRPLEYGPISPASDREHAAVGRTFLAHAAPAVRVKAAELAFSGRSADPSVVEAVVAQAAAERDPAVLAALVRVVAAEAPSNPAVEALVRRAADHDDVGVRTQGLLALVSPRRPPGPPTRVARAIEAEPDPYLRALVCRFAGALRDEALVPAFERATGEDAAAHTGPCLEGLVDLWARPPWDHPPSEAAWRLTVRRMAEGRGAPVREKLARVEADPAAPPLVRQWAAEALAADLSR